MDEEQAMRLEELNAARRQAAREAELEHDAETGEDTGEPDEEARNGGGASGAATAQTAILLLGAAKDGFDWLIDFIAIGEIPFVGQVPGMLFAGFLVYYQWSHGMFRQSSMLKKGLSVGLSVADNLPLINNLPFSTFAMWLTRRISKRQ